MKTQNKSMIEKIRGGLRNGLVTSVLAGSAIVSSFSGCNNRQDYIEASINPGIDVVLREGDPFIISGKVGERRPKKNPVSEIYVDSDIFTARTGLDPTTDRDLVVYGEGSKGGDYCTGTGNFRSVFPGYLEAGDYFLKVAAVYGSDSANTREISTILPVRIHSKYDVSEGEGEHYYEGEGEFHPEGEEPSEGEEPIVAEGEGEGEIGEGEPPIVEEGEGEPRNYIQNENQALSKINSVFTNNYSDTLTREANSEMDLLGQVIPFNVMYGANKGDDTSNERFYAGFSLRGFPDALGIVPEMTDEQFDYVLDTEDAFEGLPWTLRPVDYILEDGQPIDGITLEDFVSGIIEYHESRGN